MRALPLLFLIAAWTPLPAAAAPTYLGSFGYGGNGPDAMVDPVGMDIAPDGTVWIATAGLDKAKHFTMTGAYLGETYPEIPTPTGVTVLSTGEIVVCSAASVFRYPPDGTGRTNLGITGAYALEANPAGGFWATQRTGATSRLLSWPDLGYSMLDGSAAGFVRMADGTCYVANATLNRIDVFGGPGPAFSFGSTGSGPGQFSSPADVVIWNGHVLVADSGNHRIQSFGLDGAFRGQFGTAGTAPGQLLKPSGLAVALDGTLLVAELSNNRISRFGDIATPATASSWGRIKSLFR